MSVHQGQDEVLVEASAHTVFSVLQDSTLLHRWMPVVKHSYGKHEICGATRECDISIAGRQGRFKEVCTECVPSKRIAWSVIEETLGFGKLIEGFSFSFDLLDKGERRTVVVHQSFFKPKNLLAKIVVALVVRRKFHEVRVAALTNLKKLAEELESAPSRSIKSAVG